MDVPLGTKMNYLCKLSKNEPCIRYGEDGLPTSEAFVVGIAGMSCLLIATAVRDLSGF
jgi:hypothetical protein